MTKKKGNSAGKIACFPEIYYNFGAGILQKTAKI